MSGSAGELVVVVVVVLLMRSAQVISNLVTEKRDWGLLLMEDGEYSVNSLR